jgi:cytochrome c oxidase assembly protein subunit 15
VLGITPDDHWLARDSRLMILRFYSAIFVPSTFLFQRAVKMRPPLAMFGALRRTLPTFNAAEAFACRKNVHNTAQSGYKSARQTPFLSAFRARAAPARQQSTTAPSSSPLSELSKTIGQSSASAKNTIGQQSSARLKKSYFPETTRKSVGYWLLASSASVFGIVIFGGLTRLTESGFVAKSVPALRPSN